MPSVKRPKAFWVIVVFLAISIVLMLMGQTMALFNYDLAVCLCLQESADQVSEFGVQVNRAFGAGDTIVYIPLMIASLIGLLLKKRWSLMTTAAVVGVSAYWSVTVSFILIFLTEVSSFRLVPGPEYWIFIGVYILFGIWGLLYLIFRGETLLK